MNDLDRLRLEYADRERRLAHDDRYSTSNTAYRFMKLQLNKSIHALLEKRERLNKSVQHILEVGCGNGNVLQDFCSHGVSEEGVFGVDLLPARLHQAHTNFPLFSLTCADGQRLPFPAQSFDLVMQFTAFSSILDDQIKKNVASEMRRVVKFGGLMLWYDFWLNPTNPQTHGIRPKEIRELFPNCKFEFHKITLAPPLARRLVPISWTFASFLEGLRIFNSHYLSVIQPLI